MRPAPFAARCSWSAPTAARSRLGRGRSGLGGRDRRLGRAAHRVRALGLASQLVANWFDYSTAFDWLLTGQWSGHAAQIFVAVALWVAAPLTVGLVRTTRREIN